jgi:ParB-like chromosome segregation protein Spo0J
MSSTTTAERAKQGIEFQPVARVEWVPRERLRANSYNPNSVAPPEMRLLKLSILEAGWTQPIVARTDGEIVDGFHRWTVSADKEVSALTGGKVPVVWLNRSIEQQMMDTIRHNRARGSHRVLSMAQIVGELKARGLSDEELVKRLQMEDEEVERLADNSGMPARVGGKQGFGKAWMPDL